MGRAAYESFVCSCGAVRTIGRLSWRVEFVPADCWIGVYVKPNRALGGDGTHQAWVCVVPMLPLHLWWRA